MYTNVEIDSTNILQYLRASTLTRNWHVENIQFYRKINRLLHILKYVQELGPSSCTEIM
jgi:hypothetical protein